MRAVLLCFCVGLTLSVAAWAGTLVNGERPTGFQPTLEYTRSWYYPYDSTPLREFLDYQLSYKVESVVDSLKTQNVPPERWHAFLMEGDFADREKTAAETRTVIRKTFTDPETVIRAVEIGGPLEDFYLEKPAVILLIKVTWAKIQIKEWAYQAELFAKLQPTEKQSVRTFAEPLADVSSAGTADSKAKETAGSGQVSRPPASINPNANLVPGGASGFASSGQSVDVTQLRQEAAQREKGRKSIASQAAPGTARGGQSSDQPKPTGEATPSR